MTKNPKTLRGPRLVGVGNSIPIKISLRHLLMAFGAIALLLAVYCRLGTELVVVRIEEITSQSSSRNIKLKWRFVEPNDLMTFPMTGDFSNVDPFKLRPDIKAGREIKFYIRKYDLPFLSKTESVVGTLVDQIFEVSDVGRQPDLELHREGLAYCFEQMYQANRQK